MFKHLIFCFMLIFTLLVAISCSNGGNDASQDPLTPTPDAPQGEIASGATSCLGIWEVTINPDAGTIEAVDMRSSNLIINILGFLEPPAMSGMTIDFSTLDIDEINHTVDVDIILTHPIPDPAFMGFDVRGVVFGPKVSNADGLTIIPSPQYFKETPFGYIDGMLGAPDSFGNYEGLAGYRYFCDGLTKNADLVTFMSNPTNLGNRGKFSQSPTKNTRHYTLDWSDVTQDFMVFNYAIYANFDFPTGTPPIDINDFDPVTANSAEAFCGKVTEIANSLWYFGGSGGGSISLQVEAWDWQGDIADVTMESVQSGVISETSFTTYYGPGSTDKSYLYEFTNIPGTPAASGDLEILITVTDSQTFGEHWFMGLLPTSHPMYSQPVYNCFIHTANVTATANLQIASPNGGEQWKVGSNHDITWVPGGITGTVFIDYSKDNFVSDVHSIATGEANDGSCPWVIPNDPSTTARVRVSSTNNPTFTDKSDADFSICNIQVITPNGGELWCWRTEQDITWTSTSLQGTVNIDYSKDNFVSDIHSIATDEPNDGTYTWDIPKVPWGTGGDAKVRISSSSDPSVYDLSDGSFLLSVGGWTQDWGGHRI